MSRLLCAAGCPQPPLLAISFLCSGIGHLQEQEKVAFGGPQGVLNILLHQATSSLTHLFGNGGFKVWALPPVRLTVSTTHLFGSEGSNLGSTTRQAVSSLCTPGFPGPSIQVREVSARLACRGRP